MNFLSTNRIAELWKITPRRVAVLASQGRIPGAKQLEGRWLIPADAVKPSDPRLKSSEVQQESSDPYFFPFPLSTLNSEEQLSDFTLEETELYRLCLLYESGCFEEARALAEKLLTSENRYIRIGALYHLGPACIFLSDYPAAEQYYILFRAVCSAETVHRAETDLLVIEMEAEMGNGSEFPEKMNSIDHGAFPDSVMPLIGAFEMLADLEKFSWGGTIPNVSAYETMCRMTEANGYFYCALAMHLDLSSIYAVMQETEKETRHFKAAMDIGLKHGTLFTLSHYMVHNTVNAERVLHEYSDKVGERIRSLSKVVIAGHNGYAKYLGSCTVLNQLNADDYSLISYCLKKNSTEQMAKEYGLTRSGINKRLAVLYKKLNVKTRNELIKTFNDSLIDWGKMKPRRN